MSTTKPGSLLKNLIPIQTFTGWEEERPGFMVIDLIAHYGNTAEGRYLNTLTRTDLTSGNPLGGQRLSFPLLGINSDHVRELTPAPDASAGVNNLLYRDGLDEKFIFPRSRPNQ